MRQVCYGIVGETKMYMSECCICEDADTLDEELKYARKSAPEEDYKIVPLFTRRRSNPSLNPTAPTGGAQGEGDKGAAG